MLSELGKKPGQHGAAIDVYSFGVLLNELFCRVRPFAAFEDASLMEAMFAICTRGERPVLADEHQAPEPIRGLIQHCWHLDPKARPR